VPPAFAVVASQVSVLQRKALVWAVPGNLLAPPLHSANARDARHIISGVSVAQRRQIAPSFLTRLDLTRSVVTRT